ncbi:MFS transporter [Acidobacteria bacterium AH-259-G07]|nr:MFS transporter [Acidobacteria bacterium AH-259-G07]
MHARWWMLSLLFLVAMINYVDRQSLSVAVPAIREQFNLSATEYGQIVFAFMLAYAIMHPIAGRFIDSVGTRKGFTLAVVWWSAASMMHASARGFWSLGAYRFLLGVGEAGLLPGSVKAISEWFPKSERSLAVGVTNVGITLGAVVAPPLMTWLILTYDWRFAFLITGLLGFVWVVFWLIFYQEPETGMVSSVGPEDLVEVHQEPNSGEEANSDFSWLQLLKYRQVWGLMLARLLADPVWYFYLFWLPEYLNRERGFSLSEIGHFAWIPFVAGMVGNLVGGWIPGQLIKRGWSLTWARKGVTVASAFLMPCAILAAFVREAGLAIALISLAVFLIWIWATNLFTLPADLFPSKVVGSVYGLSGAAGSFGAVLFMPVVGVIVDNFSYTPVFVTVGLLHPAAACIILLTIPRVELISGKQKTA